MATYKASSSTSGSRNSRGRPSKDDEIIELFDDWDDDEKDLPQYDVRANNSGDIIHGVVMKCLMAIKLMVVFCKDLEFKKAFFRCPDDQQLPEGGLVHFNHAQYSESLVRQRVMLGGETLDVRVSSAALTHIPNHNIYKLETERWYHEFTVKNWAVGNIIERDQHNDIEHPLFGTILDHTKLIENKPYEKLVFFMDGMNIDYQLEVVNYFERSLMTRAEVNQEETRKWGTVGPVKVKKSDTNSLNEKTHVFESVKNIRFFESLSSDKTSCVYVKPHGAEETGERNWPCGIVRYNGQYDGEFKFEPTLPFKKFAFNDKEEYDFVFKEFKMNEHRKTWEGWQFSGRPISESEGPSEKEKVWDRVRQRMEEDAAKSKKK